MHASYSPQISEMRCVILVVLACCCLAATQAGHINRRRPAGFKDGIKYPMAGDKITMTEAQECRVYCVKKYFNCYEKNQCHMKKNEHRIEACKQVYKECMLYCKDMLHRIETGDFPPINDFIVD